MVARLRPRELSSTYQSFAETGPTYSYLDLTRTRSDESLLWTAGDEAEALVAELRASLNPPEYQDAAETEPVVMVRRPNTLFSLRSRSFTDLSSAATSVEDVSGMQCYHPGLPCPVAEEPITPDDGYCSSLNGQSWDGRSMTADGLYYTTVPVKLGTHRGSYRSLSRVGAMNPRITAKPLPTAKKVLPPTVPESSSSSASSCSSSSSNRHSGSSLSSGVFSGNEQRVSYSSSLSTEDAPQPPRSPGRDSGCESVMSGCSNTSTLQGSGTTRHGSVGSNSTSNGISSIGGGSSSSPAHYQHQHQQFTFPQSHQVSQFSHLMLPKVSPGSPHHVDYSSSHSHPPPPHAAYPHHSQMEDQGIDVQSPGRSSPGSGSSSSTSGSTNGSSCCRNSTTSLDSGRASQSTQNTTHRHSGHSSDNGSILRHSYHSSSSSLGSMEQDGSHINIQELINTGVPDNEILHAWLSELHLDEHTQKFISSGYDMPTISRMTPEDLNAIGITKPAHRKKIKQDISRLNISDGLPDFIPTHLEEWLVLLRLNEYTKALYQQNYATVDQITQITWEDLEDVGIKKLGHQKKMMLAIKRVKDIKSGKKKFSPSSSEGGAEISNPYAAMVDGRLYHQQNYGHERAYAEHLGTIGYMHPAQMHQRFPGVFPPHDKHPPPAPAPHHHVPSMHYRPDIVAVQLGQAALSSRPIIEAPEEPIYGPCLSFASGHSTQRAPLHLGPLVQRPLQRIQPLQGEHQPIRSMDDGDITPTNEHKGVYEGGGGTLPRPRNNKYRPVAKVTAKTRADIHQVPAFAKDDNKKLSSEQTYVNQIPSQIINSIPVQNRNSTNGGSASTNSTPHGTPKRMPPPLPKRSNSISENSKDNKCKDTNPIYRRGLSYGYMGVKNNLQPDLLSPSTPPPPPAPQDSGNHTHHTIEELNAFNTLNSQRALVKNMDYNSKNGELSQEFPPPPPPLTCITLANLSSNNVNTTTTAANVLSSSSSSSSNSSSQTSVIYNPHLQNNSISNASLDDNESDTDSCFRIRRNETNASFKSTSSTDSGESLPFANDNAGTIKQRVARSHSHGMYQHTRLDAMHSPRSSPLSSPAAIRRKEGVVIPTVRQPANINNNLNNVANTLDCPSKTKSILNDEKDIGSPDAAVDVLNDIGNMLANLTDELDAMLDQDK